MEFQAKWIRTSEDTGGVCPVFRKEWKTEKEVERATLYLTALGVYEACLLYTSPDLRNSHAVMCSKTCV